MTNVTANEKSNNKPKSKFLDTLLKVLMWIGIIAGAILLLVALYQIIKVVFVAVLLFLAWIFPKR